MSFSCTRSLELEGGVGVGVGVDQEKEEEEDEEEEEEKKKCVVEAKRTATHHSHTQRPHRQVPSRPACLPPPSHLPHTPLFV